MPMSLEQEHVVRDLNSRLSRLLVQGINSHPDERIADVVSQIQGALKAQEGIDPRRDLRAWSQPLREVLASLAKDL